jgi:asparagine synthase (glutamine-hydrolysing)
MCGIAGIFDTRRVLTPEDHALIERMATVVAHRGPDDSGTWFGGRVGFGHRRLSVIDLSPNGHQPMSNEDGTIWITYNGEIYNFAELKVRHRLVEKGHVFRSATDTEVMIHLYEELGPAMAKELNGIFAYAIWDSRRNELHLARDPFGVKPLFYTWRDGRFLFGSEIKCLLQDPLVPREVDLQALHDFLTFDYIPGEQTAFSGIREVKPAHRMCVDGEGRTRTERFFDLSFEEDESLDEATVVKRARELMDQAVHRQLVADVPVGVLLSGGMDSSTVVALMKRHTAEPIHTYSVGFEDASFNELPWARVVAQQFGTEAREVVVTSGMVRDLLTRQIGFIDEPYADGSAIPTYFVCERAKGEVVVVLSGEGGDEIFAGYETHAAYKASRWFAKVPGAIRHGLIAPLVRSLPVSHKKLSLEFKMKRFLGGQDLPPHEAHLWWRIVLTDAQKMALYAPGVAERITLEDPRRHFAEPYHRCRAKDVLNRLLYVDSSVFLPDDLMIKNDRMSMAHSLEARVPMTDPDLADYMSRVPARLKLPGLRKKHVMRKAMEGILPATILNKKKVGLEMPYSRWFRSELKGVLADYLGPERVGCTKLFRPEAITALVDEHMEGRRDHGRALWGLLNFMIWHGKYIG